MVRRFDAFFNEIQKVLVRILEKKKEIGLFVCLSHLAPNWGQVVHSTKGYFRKFNQGAVETGV